MPPNLARQIGEPGSDLRLRQAVVSGQPTGPGYATIKMANSATTIAGVRSTLLGTLADGDTVWVLQQGYDMLIIGMQRASTRTRFYDGVELFASTSAPYIDFHRGVNELTDAADYNMRIINEAAALLTVYGGMFRVNSTVGTNVEARGSGAGYLFEERDGEGDWVWYGSGDIARLWRSSYGDRFMFYTDRPTLSVGDRNYIGSSGAFGTDFAQFSHWAMRNDDSYGFMQASGGTVYLSTSDVIYFRVNNTTKMLIGGSSIETYTTLALYDQTIHSRAWNDSWHEWGWWSGNDGLRITEYGGLYFRVRDQDPVLELLATGQCRAQRFDQIGAYDSSALITKSNGGGTGAKVGFWSAGQNAAHILKCWGSTIEVRTWDDGGWGILRGDTDDVSTVRNKSGVRKLTATERQGRKAKMKQLEPIHYTRKMDDDDRCVNCLGTGVAAHQHQAYGDVKPGDPCPECRGTKKKQLDAGTIKNKATGFYGFSAEEMAEQFPEAVSYDMDGLPVAIKSLALAALLWEEVKELDARLEALEAKGS